MEPHDPAAAAAGLDRAAVAMINLMTWSAAIPVLDELDRRHIPVIVLKSLPQVEELYGDAGGRATGDVDLLVPASRAGETLTIARDMGWMLVRPGDFAALAPILGVGPAAARATWHLTAPPSASHAGRIDVHSDGMERWRHPPLDAEVWERAVQSTSHEVPFLLLSPEDRLIYLCWHFISDGLPWQKLGDIVRILRNGGSLDWAYIEDRARTTGMLTVVHLVCENAAARADEPLTPRWRALPVAASIRQRLLQSLIARIDESLDQRRMVALRTFSYDHPAMILAAARAAAVPSPVQLAGYGLGFEPGRDSYIIALARHYRSRF